ncbi:Uma2 family endonuclease [Pseudanabaena sp. FACHB-1277]|jgi:Uma2 family endonuclease|uniref:Uma2 family endonuclease n=1 Tax=Pseudanabaena cinerea FACHB-1277 TaxID=2949581 RepID=A0A926Z677_9CYAN|nr:Uma2 family endonuclease [Pseudanabaena cinerea]MBD2151041.1 Uma2 family endonuclease [Pseudanabaena cinerea FACHB-1277]
MVAITDPRSQPKINIQEQAIAPATKSAIPEINYPCSDGEPLAETQQHVLAILMTLALLRLYLQNQPAVVFADQFLYYIEGNSKARVAPDVMVVFDIEKRLYGNYKIWEGQQTPAIIIEVTSAGTKDTDWNFKKTLYEQLGVTEYWLFDPYGEWIAGQLQGYRLNEDGVYKPIKDNCSEVLQLRLQAEEYLIGFYRLDNGDKLLTPEELYNAALDASQRADQEAQRADQAAQRAALEKARADRLMEKLRQLGIDLDDES